jgi:hypothetical protein
MSKFLGGLAASGCQPVDPFFTRCGSQKDQDGFRAKLSDCHGTLYIQPHDHIFPGKEGLAHLRFGNALIVGIDLGVFQ